ncbi:ABC transporter ATP-binding protein [Streptococcus sanguinis]|uniref:ATP-binding cassette domain-containing protein n=1 Tax=Streptococcus sanguinis TaxID=1305 RepID=A0A7H8V2L6_STRSA|nr:ATP-binding cassette domain-containing protein [Streptococcus sanguinis]QLB50723.1 ATP-binding cassette domain-containing protein [Streptococcus sanguinis]
MENVLVLQQVSKKFGRQYALTDVSLTIKKGDIYGLIGKNGAGKTTLIKVITQLLEASNGNVSLFGSQNYQEWTQSLKRVGSVIETPVAHNHLTAYENLNYYCKLRHIPHADKVIRETLEYVDLTDTGKKKFRDFSLGMKQRLGLAIALLTRPDLMILDEPINGLDPVGIKEFRQLVQRLNEELGMTFIISSHILSELYLVGTQFGIIEEGRLIREISKAEFEEQSEDYIVLKTSQLEEASRLLQDQLGYCIKVVNAQNEIHVFTHSHNINHIVKELATADLVIQEIYYARQNLENFFTDLLDQN